MAYEAEMITYSQKIFYYLLCHGALSDLDVGVNDLYRAYVEHEEVMNLVKNQAEIADCRIERYGTKATSVRISTINTSVLRRQT